ncbi:uncharacterized protein FOMMEDRAFT_142253 [Fomitiporia mediterranea MF3/22]|uniref:uncharacterized protein n=1 Tax=Fomitiporia mediterranea (strain MF3/22) TaxID=694068 RepID=UPI00044075BD|nr:uncharacterized protein FOMMEDRAFT_142253 [Fomitiporia mediterranea MF3/22]EJD01717.1 hypothetical protein FOMMEDRAFT_142253 [Fomitiporia mediterranea MF3/22]
MSAAEESSRGLSRLPSRSKVMTSFENLVVLANYQEALRDARKMVWRDRGEPAVELYTLWECLEHAGRGGLRAGTFGFTLRSGFNMFVLLFRIRKMPRHFRFSLIRHAILGLDSFRFAAMLGSFVAVYKFLLNALPILFPPPRVNNAFSPSESPTTPFDELPMTMAPTRSERRRGRLSFRAQAHEVWIRKRTRRWHAVVAGALSGLAVLFEKKSRRVTIAQQLFVRGLQGSYNALSTRHNIKIPHGDVLVFALCCGQIMYGFLLRPDTIPPSYSTWIQNASKVPPQAVKANRTLIRDGYFEPDDFLLLLSDPVTTPLNRARIASRVLSAEEFSDFGPRYAPCEVVHPWLDSCMEVPLDRFLSVAKWMFPIYGALHLVPPVLFKWRHFLENPGEVFLRAGLGTARSSAFLGVFVVIYQTYFCLKHNLHRILSSPRSPLKLRKEWIDILISKPSFWLGGMLSGLSLFVEAKRRRGELTMYVLPKGLESAWTMARGRGYVFHAGPYGDAILCAIGMGMVMNTYQNDPQHLSGLVRRILYQFIGPN